MKYIVKKDGIVFCHCSSIGQVVSVVRDMLKDFTDGKIEIVIVQP